MSFAENLNIVKQRVVKACAKSKRNPDHIKILAVSKFQSPESIQSAYKSGIRDFGENYVQELVEKKEKLKHLEGIRWHLIGGLQTNKINLASQHIDFFHALDSIKLGQEIIKRIQKPLPVFVQVNISEENTKNGVSVSQLEALIDFTQSQSSLLLKGLMCIPNPNNNPELLRATFQKMAQLANQYSQKIPLELNMGMSEDFDIAIEEGANWIRLGRILFGERTIKG